MNQRFFDELQRAIARGFTLAAVSASLSCTKPPAPSEPVVVKAESRLREPDGGQLAQVPPDSLRCFGEENPGFHGKCCTRVHCYTPGGETCVAPGEINHGLGFTPRLPLGSGTCSCGERVGPFAQTDGGVTECCYVLGTMGCSGRPLREGEDAVVASVITRTDWV